MNWEFFFTSSAFENHAPVVFTLPELCKKFNLKKNTETYLIIQEYLLKKNLAVNADILDNTKKLQDMRFYLKKSFMADRMFTVKPSDFEIKNDILIPGSRFQWITSPETQYEPLQLIFQDTICAYKTFPISCDVLQYYYYLNTENEWLNEVLNQNPKNLEHVPMLTLSTVLSVDVIKMHDVYAKLDIHSGDMLEVRFSKKKKYTVEILCKKQKSTNQKKITEYQEIFDERVSDIAINLQNFATPYTILTHLFFLEDKTIFFKPEISIESLLKSSQVISCIPYGFQAILWQNDTPLPITNSWSYFLDSQEDEGEVFFNTKLKAPLTVYILDTIIEKFLADDFFENSSSSGKLYTMIEKTFISPKLTSPKDIDFFYEIVHYRKEVILKRFNPFKELDKVKILRNTIISFYLNIVGFVKDLIEQDFTPSSFANQEGIMVNQLLQKVITITKFFSFRKQSFAEFYELHETILDMNETFKVLKNNIESQIKRMKNI